MATKHLELHATRSRLIRIRAACSFYGVPWRSCVNVLSMERLYASVEYVRSRVLFHPKELFDRCNRNRGTNATSKFKYNRRISRVDNMRFRNSVYRRAVAALSGMKYIT